MAGAAAMRGQEAARYTGVAIWLHWTIAALLIGNIFLGLYHDSFGRPVTAWMMFVHKAVGLSVLGLTLVRFAYRLLHRPPACDPVLKRWEQGLASFIHWLFYAMLIAIPLTGWLLSSSNGRVTDYFGLFEVAPLPVPRSDDLNDLFEDLHEWLAKAVIGLVLLHVAGALKHHLQGHRQVMGRMAPWLYRDR
ncbi:MAG TPA: cytochrome b [Allosphingosinicella sp.]|nr:cytochrome b [Allosphingosinicella sp.]